MSAPATARLAARGAGRGLRPAPAGPPAGRGAGRGRGRPGPALAPPPRSAAPPRLGAAAPGPGSFAASVLAARGAADARRPRRAPRGAGPDARPHRDAFADADGAGGARWRNREGRDGGGGGGNAAAEWEDRRAGGGGARGGGRDGGAVRQAKARDWFSSASRVAALEQAASASAEFAAAARENGRGRRAGDAQEQHEPFAGGSFAGLAGRVPDAHWAAPYVAEVTSALEVNPDIGATQKQRILSDTVNALVSFGLASPKAAYTTPQAPSFADYLLALSDPPPASVDVAALDDEAGGGERLKL